ncbi:MAG: hypothetical protein GC204_17540 [Chloroflexi bacterium]|nr:hypothetical protein [Chloroflexota bacterium]
MAKSLEISDYYELVALYRALRLFKFSRNPVDDRIVGSPFLANIANRTVEVLNEMEIERGRPERANWAEPIIPDSEVWQIAVRNAADSNEGYWRNFSPEQKREFAAVLLSPFSFTDDMLADFIADADAILDGKS